MNVAQWIDMKLKNETPDVNEDLVSRQNQPVFAGYRKTAGRFPRAVFINVLCNSF